MGVSASSAAGSCGYSRAASSVRIRVHPWLLPRGAIQQRVHLCPFVVTDRKLDFQGGGPGGGFSAKMPEKTKELDQVLTAFITEVKATTVQTKTGKDE